MRDSAGPSPTEVVISWIPHDARFRDRAVRHALRDPSGRLLHAYVENLVNRDNDDGRPLGEYDLRTMGAATGLKPHLLKTFKVSNDPRFEEKLRDVVGLYLNPPEHAIVLSVDEKSQIQALNRTQKSLPMFPGRLGTMTHDYKRNGTTTLFAALNVADGSVVASLRPRHRHNEWLEFLRTLDETYPDVDLHIICDNYATHKHQKVQRWLKRHPRIHVHFTPTSSSWLNQVERWFRNLTDRCIRRGSFTSVAKLEEAIWDYIDRANEEPQPFRWTAKADDILVKVARARQALDKSPSE